MIGDRIVDEGVEYEVTWDGYADRAGVVPSLCSHRGNTALSDGVGLDRRYRDAKDPLARAVKAEDRRTFHKQRVW